MTWNPGAVEGLNSAASSSPYSSTMSDAAIARANATPSTPAPSVGDVKLPFGQFGRDGSLVISDGSSPGGIPRTISDAQLQQIGGQVNAGGNYGAPGLGVATSEATGGASTPTYALSPADGVRRPTPTSVGDGDDITASANRASQSDIASILNEDPRSALGTAARNARINLNGIQGPRKGRYAFGPSPYENVLGSLLQRAAAPVAEAAAQQLANTRAESQQAIDANNNAASVDRATIGSNARVAAADSRAGATLGAAQITSSRPRTNAAFEHGSAMAYANAYNQALQNGMSQEQAIAQAQQNRDAFERRSGQQPQTAAPPAATPSDGLAPVNGGPPAAAVQFLRDNPQYASHFDQKYGNGAARQYMRQ